ncbi:MAG TPA: flagellin [Geminicoccaceae bacterium]|nr:flagellin [Geminicoccaceae bacterium]
MSSILTNTAAMTALQTLKGINRNLAMVQDQVSTGRKVNNAKDNAGIWAVSSVMDSDVRGFKAISESLSLGQSTVAVARNATETVKDLLIEMKALIVTAQGENVDRAKIQNDVTALAEQINTTIQAAQFNGKNLLLTASTAMDVLASLDRDAAQTVTARSITVTNQDVEAIYTAVVAYDVEADAAGALTDVETQIQAAIDAAAAFGSAEKRLDIQASFVSKLMDSMTAGIGALVDADMEAASARLNALTVQQQLGLQSLSIANSNPQGLLSLFR